MAEQVAILAGGCFWCTEAVFLDVVGVKSVESGYTGGTSPIRPTSRSAAATPAMPKRSAITFDPDQLSYDDLLDIFFATHDPTQLNRQGNDVGTQYRSAIFPLNEEQERKARAAIERANADHGGRVVTTIEPHGRMVAGRGLSPGLLGRRGPAQSLLHRDDPAQAAEAAQELPGAAARKQPALDETSCDRL